MTSFPKNKPRFNWKPWLISNGTFLLLVVFGLSYGSTLTYLMAFCFVVLHLVMYFVVYVALQHLSKTYSETYEKVINSFVNNNTHPPFMLDMVYDGLLIGYIISVQAYAFAALYAFSMLLQYTLMHKSELHVAQRNPR